MRKRIWAGTRLLFGISVGFAVLLPLGFFPAATAQEAPAGIRKPSPPRPLPFRPADTDDTSYPDSETQQYEGHRMLKELHSRVAPEKRLAIFERQLEALQLSPGRKHSAAEIQRLQRLIQQARDEMLQRDSKSLASDDGPSLTPANGGKDSATSAPGPKVGPVEFVGLPSADSVAVIILIGMLLVGLSVGKDSILAALQGARAYVTAILWPEIPANSKHSRTTVVTSDSSSAWRRVAKTRSEHDSSEGDIAQ